MQTSFVYILYNWSYCQWKFYIVGIGIFNFFAPVTDDLQVQTWPVSRGDTLRVQI